MATCALLLALTPTVTFIYAKGYVLDGGMRTKQWDSGRYSESRVWFYNGCLLTLTLTLLAASYSAVSSLLFTTTTYGCLHVERIAACHFFYTYT